jgi:hypothetical protein
MIMENGVCSILSHNICIATGVLGESFDIHVVSRLLIAFLRTRSPSTVVTIAMHLQCVGVTGCFMRRKNYEVGQAKWPSITPPTTIVSYYPLWLDWPRGGIHTLYTSSGGKQQNRYLHAW